MTLDTEVAQLLRLVTPAVSVSAINRCTDFALKATDENRADLSVAVLTPLSKFAPSSPRVWQILGLAHRQLQNSVGALNAFARAAALAPRDSRIANGHATAAMEAGVPSALLFKAARDLAPNDPELLLSTVAALKADGFPDVAETVLAQNVAANPAWIRGHEALATLRLTMTADENFARSFSDAAAQSPNDLAIYVAWQRTLAQAGQWDAARDVIDLARFRIGQQIELDAAAGNIAAETGDNARADELFARTIALDDPGTRISYIRHCLRTGRIDQAEAIATDALTRQLPTSVWGYLSLIWRLRDDPRAAWLDGAPPMISVTDLPFTSGELAELAMTLRRLHITRHHPAEQSVRGGTQTEGILFARISYIRHCLRAGRIDQAEAIATDALTRQLPTSVWSYLSLIWR